MNKIKDLYSEHIELIDQAFKTQGIDGGIKAFAKFIGALTETLILLLFQYHKNFMNYILQ